MVKALITGAHGFIAKHIISDLKREGIEIIPVPREVLSNPLELARLLSECKPDYIYHTAAYGNMANQQEISQTVVVNLMCTWNLLIASKDIPYKAFINFGSSSEYGKKDSPMIEEMLPSPETFYAASKIGATALCEAFTKQYNKPIVTVRPFSVYGDGEAEFRFIPRIILALHTKSQMDVNIKGVHDWIYIDDLIKGVKTVVKNINKLKGQVVNIGTGIETSNKQIIEYLEDLSGQKLNINYIENNRPQDSPVWIDGSKKLRKLGWKPEYDLEHGLMKTYAYYCYE